MKFLVSEMPFWIDDCPFYDFYDHNTCKLDGNYCEYMNDNAGHRCEKDCRWLQTVSEKKDKDGE